MAKPVVHTVENLEAGQRDSIRRARAKAEGASKEELANLPSDAEVNAAGAKRLAAKEAEGAESSGQPAKPSPAKTPETSGAEARRGPPSNPSTG